MEVNEIFVEKYRPKIVEEIISPYKDKILNYLKDNKSIPNFLFYNSIPGNGKTTFAKAIINQLGCDYLYLNGSDERGIDVVREKIKKFAISKSFKDGKKCVLLDEADKITKDGQDALRPITEEYSSNCFFIMTGNYIEKFTDALLSRFQKFHLNNPEKSEICKRLVFICKQENIKCDKSGIVKLMEIYYPNIRDMIAKLQDLKMDKKDCVESNIKKESELYEDIYKMIKRGDYNKIRDIIIKQGIDVSMLNKEIFYFIMKDNIEYDKMKFLMEILAETEYRFGVGVNYTIVFCDAVLKMIDIFKKKVR